MVADAITLLKNYNFILKIIELVIAFASLGFLVHYEIFEIPKWLWIIYSIDTTTYAFILLVITAAYILEAKHEPIDFIFSTIGALLYSIGGLSGILRYNFFVNEKILTGQNEVYIGTLLGVNALLMLFEVILTILKTRGHLDRNLNESVQQTVRL